MKLEFKKTYHADPTTIPQLLKYFTEHIGPFITDEKIGADCLLALDEAATNIVLHAYKDFSIEEDKVLDTSFIIEDSVLQILLCDRGKVFNPKQVPKPDVQLNLKGKKKGGFGIFLIKKLMDSISFIQKNGENRLLMVKHIS